MGNDMTPEDMFNKMMEDQAKMIAAQQAQQQIQQATPVPQGQPGEPPILDAKEQMVLNELQNKPAVVNTGVNPSQVPSSLPTCSVCGMLHPPNSDGSPCGNAPVTGGNVADLDMEINKYLMSLKNIAVSQIQSKGIKNINKLLQYMTIDINKLVDGYNEW